MKYFFRFINDEGVYRKGMASYRVDLDDEGDKILNLGYDLEKYKLNKTSYKVHNGGVFGSEFKNNRFMRLGMDKWSKKA